MIAHIKLVLNFASDLNIQTCQKNPARAGGVLHLTQEKTTSHVFLSQC